MSQSNKIDELLRSATSSGKVPGVVAMLTDREGITYQGAYGVRTLGQEAEMTPDTVVWLASMTKALTSTAALQLLEQGKLELDEPARRWLPELNEILVLDGFDASGAAITRSPKTPITLRHLLTHTAGFGYDFFSADLARFEKQVGLPGITTCENAALRLPLLFDPGSRWNYGINIEWVGKLVEAAAGCTLGQYLTEHLFEPLGMHDTAFRISPAMRERLAVIHQRGDDGGLTPLEGFEIPQEPEFEMGGGGLYGTAADYLKFIRMVLNRGQAGKHQLLKPETVDELLYGNQLGELRVCELKTAMPPVTGDAEFFPGVEKSWSLAFQRMEAPAPIGLPEGGLMWAGLANTYYWIDPVNGTGGVYLSQILPFVDRYSAPLFHDFMAAAYA